MGFAANVGVCAPVNQNKTQQAMNALVTTNNDLTLQLKEKEKQVRELLQENRQLKKTNSYQEIKLLMKAKEVEIAN